MSDLYDLAHAAGRGPCNLHDLAHIFLGWICTIQTLHSTSERQFTILDVVQMVIYLIYLSDVCNFLLIKMYRPSSTNAHRRSL